MPGATRVGARGPRACLDPRAPVPGCGEGAATACRAAPAEGIRALRPLPGPRAAPAASVLCSCSALPRCPLAEAGGSPPGGQWQNAASTVPVSLSVSGGGSCSSPLGSWLLGKLKPPGSAPEHCLPLSGSQKAAIGNTWASEGARRGGGAAWCFHQAFIELLARPSCTPPCSTWPSLCHALCAMRSVPRTLCHALCACCCSSIFLPLAPAGLSLPCPRAARAELLCMRGWSQLCVAGTVGWEDADSAS